MEQYLEQLSTRFAVGRADIAQKLHALGELKLSDSNAEVEKRSVRGGDKKQVVRTAEERCVDSWIWVGENGEWIRAHRTPRRSMFTPHRVAGGPGKEVLLNKIRITNGTYVGTGESFQIIDDYCVASSAHKMLAHGWVGTSHFREIDQQVEIKIGRTLEDPAVGRSPAGNEARVKST